jgi:hypothetical protein
MPPFCQDRLRTTTGKTRKKEPRLLAGDFQGRVCDGAGGRAGKKTALFEPFIYKMHYFTKTGSGQT